MIRPLRGVRVLDLSRLLPGPYLTRVLADLGAEVIKIEAPDGGDMLRWLPPSAGAHGAAFAALNYGKRSLALDLKLQEGREVFLALLDKADVVVESFRPGVLERLELSYSRLCERQPALIMVSLSGYGATGPLATAPGHDLGYVARAGLLELFGPVGATPAVPGVQLADVAGGGLTAAVGLLSALLERQRTGKGAHLEVSMTRGATAFLAMELARRSAGLREERGGGTLTGGLPCYRLYETKDGRFMALAALEPKFFAAFCQRAGCEQLSGAGLTTGEEGEAVVGELSRLFRTRTQAEWTALVAGSDACCEPVRTPEEAARDEALGLEVVDLDGAWALATDVGFGPLSAEPRVPGLGADAAAVLADFAVPGPIVERARVAGALVEPVGGERRYP